MTHFLRLLLAAAFAGLIGLVAEYQSLTAAIMALAAAVAIGFIGVQNALDWHGKLIDRLNGIRDE